MKLPSAVIYSASQSIAELTKSAAYRLPKIEDNMPVCIDKLKQIPQFATVPANVLETVSERSWIEIAEPGTTVIDIFSSGPAEVFSFLLGGEWTMRRFVRGIDRPATWTDSRVGSWHGGVVLIDAIAPALVVADITSQILRVPADLVVDLARSDAGFARAMLRGLHGGAELLQSFATAEEAQASFPVRKAVSRVGMSQHQLR